MSPIGFQTILFGVSLRELDRALEALALAGYTGVEFGQNPNEIQDGRPDTLRLALNRHGLELLGLAGGNLLKRIEFCRDILKPQYFYVEQVGKEERQVLTSAKHHLALHLHVSSTRNRLG